jgi:hypothetical protein
MANEINVYYEVTGLADFVAVLYTPAGQLINATSGVAMNDTDANLPNAAIALADTGHAGHYTNAAPIDGNIVNGNYAVKTWRKVLNGAAGALARSDTLTPPVNEGTITVGVTGGGGGGGSVTIEQVGIEVDQG